MSGIINDCSGDVSVEIVPLISSTITFNASNSRTTDFSFLHPEVQSVEMFMGCNIYFIFLV
jgi:hypothetical protein